MRASLTSRKSFLAVVLSAWLLSLQLVLSTSTWFADGLLQLTRSEDGFDRQLAGLARVGAERGDLDVVPRRHGLRRIDRPTGDA